ncbi:MAG TPA: protein kinase, partial [Myxococcaceae bacterium]
MLNIPGYTLLGALKTTGTSLLFRAVRDADGLQVILKTPVLASPGPRERERYRREFGILQRLADVRGVTRAYACEQVHDRPVLLLESLDGKPLSELTGEPFEVLRAVELAISVASTLAELHRRGIVHKDIKPSNIIITPSGETRLIDFGTASLQLIEHVEATHALLAEGTLAYMSPEQTGRMNRSVDYRTDLYSLGVCLYELLTGQVPFSGADAMALVHGHIASQPRPPHQLQPGVPPAVSRIVLKLLAKDAEERYQSTFGLMVDLKHCVEQLEATGTIADFEPGKRDVSYRFQIPQRLYGREAECATLLAAFDRICQGTTELLLVSGYSGVGKSSLVNEVHRPLARQQGYFSAGK